MIIYTSPVPVKKRRPQLTSLPCIDLTMDGCNSNGCWRKGQCLVDRYLCRCKRASRQLRAQALLYELLAKAKQTQNPVTGYTLQPSGIAIGSSDVTISKWFGPNGSETTFKIKPSDRHDLSLYLPVAQSAQPNVLGKIRKRLCSHVNLNFCRQLPAFAIMCACQA